MKLNSQYGLEILEKIAEKEARQKEEAEKTRRRTDRIRYLFSALE